MAWFVLFIAGALEVAWALGLKYTEGFTKPLPSLLTGGAIVASMLLLAHASRTLPIGTAYAVWVGIGVVGTTVGGMWLFDEAMPPLRVFLVALLVVCIVGLKVTAAPLTSAPAEGAPAEGAPAEAGPVGDVAASAETPARDGQ